MGGNFCSSLAHVRAPALDSSEPPVTSARAMWACLPVLVPGLMFVPQVTDANGDFSNMYPPTKVRTLEEITNHSCALPLATQLGSNVTISCSATVDCSNVNCSN